MGSIMLKPIKGYEGQYSIDEGGNVHNLKTNTILKHILKKNGYLVITLYSENPRYYQVGIHRLLAIAFIPNPHDKKEVNHKDGNKQNNNLDNLEWVTSRENNIHALKTGLRRINHGEKHNWCKTTTEELARLVKENIKLGLTNRQIANKLNIPHYNVYDIRVGKSWSWV